MKQRSARDIPLFVPPKWRGTTLTMMAVCGLVITGLGVKYGGDSVASGLDLRFDSVLHLESPWSRKIFLHLVRLGDPGPFIAMTTLMALCGLFLFRRGIAVALAIGGPLIAMSVTVLFLKPIVARTHDGGFSFPSGHMTAIGSVLTVAAVFLFASRWPSSAAVRAAMIVAIALFGMTVAVALVVLKYHYATDTIGGMCVAISAVLGLALLIDCSHCSVRRSRWLGGNDEGPFREEP